MKKTALVTGASSGIGQEIARIHAEKGGDLVLVARREDRLRDLQQELQSKHGVTVHILAKDLTSAGAPQEIYETLKTQGIKIDYLINNAGYGLRGVFHELDETANIDMILLNVVSLTKLTHLFLPGLIKRKGRILNVSSTASLMPGPLQAVYYATKAYVTSFSNAVAEELRGTKVSVTTLLPGATESEFAKVSGMDQTDLFNSTVTARSVAEDGYRAMVKGKLNVISGLTTGQKLMLKMLPLMPKRSVLKMIRKMQEV